MMSLRNILIDSDEIVHSIEELILSSKRYLILICPYWNFDRVENRYYLNNVRNLVNRKIEEGIVVICIFKPEGKDTRSYETFNDQCWRGYERVLNYFGYNKSNQPSNFHVKYNENFHSKLYMNELDCIISSMNLTGREKNSEELGIYIHEYTDSLSFSTKLRQYIIEISRNCKIDEIIKEILN